jgi:hypothetical protein
MLGEESRKVRGWGGEEAYLIMIGWLWLGFNAIKTILPILNF